MARVSLAKIRREFMRVESPLVPQSLIESPKAVDIKEVANNFSPGELDGPEDSSSYFPSPFGSSGTYSISSLRAAVDYHAKFLTVAENNMQAVNHPAAIPQLILDRLNAR
jgi:hypothetical protein